MIEMGLSPTIHAASFGIQDSLFLMLLALVVFGPRRLPEIGRQIGKLMYEFRKVSNDFKFQMEEELRASEEADRQRKLEATIAASASSQVASSQVLLDVPPQPAAETASEESSAALPGEVRAEPRKFPPAIPTIQPPSSGDPVEAQRPFRGRIDAETVTESGSEPVHATEAPVVVADEGRIGTEVQPGVETEREAHHA